MDNDVGTSSRTPLGSIGTRVKAFRKPLPRTIVTRVNPGERFEPPAGEVSFRKAVIEGVDFRGTRWDDFSAAGSLFVDCDFREARFTHAGFGSISGQTTFRRCRFDAADLRNADPAATRFEDCRFDDAHIEEWRCFLTEVVACRFTGRLVKVIFSGRPWGPGADKLRPRRTVNDFYENDFRTADLIDCAFVNGIDISRQSMPAGEDYVYIDRAPQRIARAKRLISEWPDASARKQALVLLQVYSTSGYEEQAQVFARRDDLDVVPLEVRDRVWRLLEAQ
jgi:hypothetical protein